MKVMLGDANCGRYVEVKSFPFLASSFNSTAIGECGHRHTATGCPSAANFAPRDDNQFSNLQSINCRAWAHEVEFK